MATHNNQIKKEALRRLLLRALCVSAFQERVWNQDQ
jgi:hypothetical protein